MTLTFLGTGTSQGIPVIGCNCIVCKSIDLRDKRLRSSIHIEVEKNHFNIDIGTDFRQQMLTNKIEKIDALLITHEHKDHTGGLDDIRPFCFSQKESIPLYARNEVLKHIKKEFSYIFSQKKYPGVPSIEMKSIKNAPFYINDIHITPIQVLHHKLPVFGFRINDFAYITDANFISKKEKKKILGLKVLVLNALQLRKHISHFTLNEALALIEEVKPKKAYLTHISHNLGLHKEIKLPANVHLAHDGLKIDI